MSNAVGRSDVIFKRANHTGGDGFGRLQQVWEK